MRTRAENDEAVAAFESWKRNVAWRRAMMEKYAILDTEAFAICLLEGNHICLCGRAGICSDGRCTFCEDDEDRMGREYTDGEVAAIRHSSPAYQQMLREQDAERLGAWARSVKQWP